MTRREPTTEAGRNLMVEVDAAAHRGGGISVARTRERLLAIEDEARTAAMARDEWRDHIPSGGTDMAGYGYVSCSCGWDSSEVLGWEQHINAAALTDDPS